MVQPTLPARPRPPALAPLRAAQSTPRRAQTILREAHGGELDEVMPRLPAFDRVPFAAPGGIDNRFLEVQAPPQEPGRGLPAVPVAVVSRFAPLLRGEASVFFASGGFDARDMQAEAQLTTYDARTALQVRLPRELDYDPGDGWKWG